MICELCKGKGWTQGQAPDIPTACPACGGKGFIDITNEEWFCGLSTTEKSEFLSTMVKEAIEVHEKHGITWHETVSWWDGWLKEIHHDN